MKSDVRESVTSFIFVILITLMTAWMIRKYLYPLAWGGVIAIATWTPYQWLTAKTKAPKSMALLLTVIISLVLIVPASWFLLLLAKETVVLSHILIDINQTGSPTPTALQNLPLIGNIINNWWAQTFGQPGGLQTLLHRLLPALTNNPTWLKIAAAETLHRSIVLSFSMLCLFFAYLHGQNIHQKLNLAGNHLLGKRWFHYADDLPRAIRGVVNGTVITGLFVGIIMGIGYTALGLPLPALLGAVTAFLAMIPYASIAIFVGIALFLLLQHKLMAMIIILILGLAVDFIADHFIKPWLIGDKTQLRFLPVLFAILGGLETFGLLGLFLGPVVMVLFMKLWTLPKDKDDAAKHTLPLR